MKDGTSIFGSLLPPSFPSDGEANIYLDGEANIYLDGEANIYMYVDGEATIYLDGEANIYLDGETNIYYFIIPVTCLIFLHLVPLQAVINFQNRFTANSDTYIK